MDGREKALQALSLVAIVVLTAVVFDLVGEPDADPEVVYVLVDNRILIEENATVVELDRSEVARIASFNIKVFGDTKMSNATVVAELVDLFQAYDMVAVQEIKDIDEEVPYLFLDELNGIAGQDNVSNQTQNWSMVLSERSGQQEDDRTRRSSTPTTTGPRCSGRWTTAPCTTTARTIPSSVSPSWPLSCSWTPQAQTPERTLSSSTFTPSRP